MNNHEPAASVISALEYAAHRHRFDYAKNEEPYINHILKVSGLLMDIAEVSNKQILIAGCLQHIFERTSVRPSEIVSTFGDEVCKLILEVTEINIVNESDRFEKMFTKPRPLSANGKLIRMADMIAQVESMLSCPPSGWDIERRNIYLHWAQNLMNIFEGTNEKLDNYFRNIISEWDIERSMVA